MAARSDSLTDESEINQEIEVLKHIYIEELEVILDGDAKVETIKVLLHPSTCEDTSVQYVCLTLVFNIPHTYPYDAPEIFIKNPRGLAEEEVKGLHDDLVELAEERKGAPMLFELIEFGKESLTEGNIPRCECVVCLERFHEGDVFTKTVCYHYFHCHCLARYINHSLSKCTEKTELHQKDKKEEGVVCPVCRTPIEYDLKELADAPPPVEDSSTLEISASIRQLQEQMREMYEKQKEKGGIIDVEAEKNKFLISEQNPDDLAQTTAQNPDDINGGKSTSVIDGKQGEENKSQSQEGQPRVSSKDKPARHYDGRNGRYYNNSSYGDRYHGNKDNKDHPSSSYKESYRDRYYGKRDPINSSAKESYRDRYYGNRNSQNDRYHSNNRDAHRESYRDKYYGKQGSKTENSQDKNTESNSPQEGHETKRKEKENNPIGAHGHFDSKGERVESGGHNASSYRGRGRRTYFPPGSASRGGHGSNKSESVDRNKTNAEESHRKNESNKINDSKKDLQSAEDNVNNRDRAEENRRGQGRGRGRGRGRGQSSKNSKPTRESNSQGEQSRQNSGEKVCVNNYYKSRTNPPPGLKPPPGFKPLPDNSPKQPEVKAPPGFSYS